ncbi:MAG TPA: DUF72 domain-containing protein [Flavitalea sp.]|nr:DUF72 domain-containing protein [Flavitalea sp.]
MKTKFHIGCSGFHYKHWRGGFYPEKLAQKNWFDFYCQHFSTLELNVTFYRFPQLSFLQNWYIKSPPHFKFAVKAPRLITHYKQFNDTHDLITEFYSVIQNGLEDKLGCVLFQLPPRLAYNETRLDKIISAVDTNYKNTIEFRHVSWWRNDVYEKLAKNNISFCGMSHPLLPQDIIQNTSFLYYRFHGIPELYKSPYDLEVLKKAADEIGNSGKTKEAFIYFNNDIEVSAIDNAKQMRIYAEQMKNLSKGVSI